MGQVDAFRGVRSRSLCCMRNLPFTLGEYRDMSDDLTNADSRHIVEPMANMLKECGPQLTLQWLTELLEKQRSSLRSSNSHLVAYTGCAEAMEWLENNVISPVSTHWGEAAALLGVSWELILSWLQSERTKQLMALDAIYACRLPAPNMAPLAQIVAPVLINAPTKQEFESVLNETVAKAGTARIRQTVGRIMTYTSEILVPRKRVVQIFDLPELFIDPESFPNAKTILGHHDAVMSNVKKSMQEIVENDISPNKRH